MHGWEKFVSAVSIVIKLLHSSLCVANPRAMLPPLPTFSLLYFKAVAPHRLLKTWK